MEVKEQVRRVAEVAATLHKTTRKQPVGVWAFVLYKVRIEIFPHPVSNLIN